MKRAGGVSGAIRSIAFGAIVCAPACHRVSPVTDDSGAAALMRNLVRARAVDVLVEPGPLEEACQRLASAYGGRDPIDFRVNPPSGRERSSAARIVVGTLAVPRVGLLLDRMQVLHGDLKDGKGFKFQEQMFAGEGDVLIATFEDPDRPGLPVTLLCGNDAEQLARALGDLTPAWRPWMQCFRAGELALSGPLWTDGHPIAHRIGRIAASKGAIPPGHSALPPDVEGLSGSAAADVSPERASEYLARASRARSKISAFLGVPSIPKVDVTLYAFPEQLVPKVGNLRLSGVNPMTRAAYVLCASGVPDDGGAAAAEACALQALGIPVHPWLLAGASVDAAGSYFGVDLERWIAWLSTSGRTIAVDPTEPDLRSDRSMLVRVPLQAALFRFLCETRGDAVVRQIWHGRIPFAFDDALRGEFQKFLEQRASRFAKEFETRRAAPIPRRASNSVAKGVALEASNERLAAGYGSKRFQAALDALPALNVNTLVVTSYLVDEPDPPEFAGFQNRRVFGPVEGDLGLFCALWQARARGLSSWIEPHWLSAPAGSFRGSWVREQQEAIADFGSRYSAFVEEYALLAELCGADVLSIGTDLRETALVVSESRRANPAATEWKRAAWNDVLRTARSVYSGRLTYVASTPDDLAKIEWWPMLDAIAYVPSTALDDRYPGGMYAARTVLAERLTKELNALEAACAAHDRPLYLMNVSFENEVRPTRRTLSGVGAPQVDEPLVESATFFDVLLGPARPKHLEGVVLWRWGIEPDDRGDAFVIRGGSVESTMRRALARL